MSERDDFGVGQTSGVAVAIDLRTRGVGSGRTLIARGPNACGIGDAVVLFYLWRSLAGQGGAAFSALIMRAFYSAITLCAANICASRVVSSENGRTVWR